MFTLIDISLAVESHEVHEDIVNVSEISHKPLRLEVKILRSRVLELKAFKLGYSINTFIELI